jgi:hypothetical protein
MTAWRSATWARWLGWTAVLALLFALVLLPFAFHIPHYGGHLLLVCLAVTLLTAYAIGARFPYERWIFGPPVAIVATVVTFPILPEWGPAKPGPVGNLTPKDELLFVLIWGGWAVLGLLALVYSALAYAGVRWGQRRHAAGAE